MVSDQTNNQTVRPETSGQLAGPRTNTWLNPGVGFAQGPNIYNAFIVCWASHIIFGYIHIKQETIEKMYILMWLCEDAFYMCHWLYAFCNKFIEAERKVWGTKWGSCWEIICSLFSSFSICSNSLQYYIEPFWQHIEILLVLVRQCLSLHLSLLFIIKSILLGIFCFSWTFFSYFNQMYLCADF